MRLLLLFCLLIPALSFNLKEARKNHCPTCAILKHANTLKSSMKMKFIASSIPRLLSWHGIKNNLKHSDYMKYGDEYLSNSNGKYKSLHSIIKKGNMKEIRITERGHDHLKGIIHTKHEKHRFNCTRAGCEVHTKRLKSTLGDSNSTLGDSDHAAHISNSVILTIILGLISVGSLM